MMTLGVWEQVLHYFQGTCKSAVAEMPLPKQHTFKANTHVLAAEAYARWRGMKSNSAAALKTELLDTLKKFYDELATHCASRLPNASLPKPVEP